MSDGSAAALDQENAAVATGGRRVDERTESVQNSRQLVSQCHHFQEPPFAGQQHLCSFWIIDVCVLALPELALHEPTLLEPDRCLLDCALVRKASIRRW